MIAFAELTLAHYLIEMEDNLDANCKGKEKRFTIVWTNTLLKELLTFIYTKRYHLEKSFARGCEKVALNLVNESPYFKNYTLSGAVCKSRADSAINAYQTKFLEQGSNKSGFSGDREDESNYSEVEWMAKKIYDEVEENRVLKDGVKLWIVIGTRTLGSLFPSPPKPFKN